QAFTAVHDGKPQCHYVVVRADGQIIASGRIEYAAGNAFTLQIPERLARSSVILTIVVAENETVPAVTMVALPRRSRAASLARRPRGRPCPLTGATPRGTSPACRLDSPRTPAPQRDRPPPSPRSLRAPRVPQAGRLHPRRRRCGRERPAPATPAVPERAVNSSR